MNSRVFNEEGQKEDPNSAGLPDDDTPSFPMRKLETDGHLSLAALIGSQTTSQITNHDHHSLSLSLSLLRKSNIRRTTSKDKLHRWCSTMIEVHRFVFAFRSDASTDRPVTPRRGD